MKKGLKRIFEKIFGVKVYRILPFGVDPLSDIHQRVKGYNFKTIFDIGANIGQSAKEFKQKEQQAHLHCFEPSLTTFETLKKNTAHLKGISYHQLAFGNERKTILLAHANASDMNRIVGENEAKDKLDVETVNMETVVNFCRENKINHISYLKIDTEGYDLEVLKSAAELFQKEAVDFVEVETGMSPTNELHVPFEQVKSYMEKMNYCVFGIYEQISEFKLQKLYLRRCNAVFISRKMSSR